MTSWHYKNPIGYNLKQGFPFSIYERQTGVLGGEMQIESILKSYARYAPLYDQTFGWLLSFRGRSMAVGVANKQPGSVLEVGVGTGISLSYYRKEHQVFGIDISPHMLARAQKRVARKKLNQVSKLELMDAREMNFADNSFNAVIAAYVMSVVPDPEKVISEIERVCKPGGDVIIVNHFAAEKGLRRAFESMLSPFSDMLGWRTDMPLEEILAHTSLREIKRHKLPPLGLFTMLHLKKEGMNGHHKEELSPHNGQTVAPFAAELTTPG